MRKLFRNTSGFSLADMVVTVAIGTTIAAVSIPVASQGIESMRLTSAMRQVEQQIQTARLRAVSSNRPMRVRFNCPAAGQVRVVEITGMAATDTAGNRCSDTAYPFPSTRDSDPATPSQDGPVLNLHSTVTVAANDLQFTPKGTASQMVSGTLQPIGTPVSVTVTKGANTKQVTVNGLGKIQIQ